jgi:hypothetical protein
MPVESGVTVAIAGNRITEQVGYPIVDDGVFWLGVSLQRRGPGGASGEARQP